jgi:predicted dehydrogenase
VLDKKVGVAVVGAGFVGGQAHVPAFNKIPGSELVALGDQVEERIKKYADKYHVKYYLDYNQLLDDPKVQAVVLAVPTPFHYEMSMKAISKGKHVLCEMPLAPRASEAERLGKEAEKAGVTLMPVLNFRFTPNYVKAKELIDAGKIGKPAAVSFREFIAAKDLAMQWPANSWAWNIEKSGGYPDFTLSVWSIDLLRWLLNAEITEVDWKSSYAPLKEYGGIKSYNTMGLVKFSTGAVGALHFSSMVAPVAGTSRLEVFGEKTYNLLANWNDSLTLIGQDPERQEWVFKEGGTKVWGHYQLDEYFIQCIRKHQNPKITAEDAVKAIEVASKIVK